MATAFQSRTTTIPPASELAFIAADWKDSIVIVERGRLEVECCAGSRSTFAAGAIITFAQVSLRCLRNVGDVPVVLTSLNRVS